MIKICTNCNNEFSSTLPTLTCSEICKKIRVKEIRKKHYENNKEKILTKNKKYFNKNKKFILKQQYENNKEKRKQYAKEYYHKTKDIRKEHKTEYLKEHYKNNKARYIAHDAKRRASKLNATPVWLSKFDHDYIKHIYIQAKELQKLDGIPRHVDHIIPLQGKTVCGLHVPWNLQILTATENASKGNRI